jgi:hypothetical protein
MIRVRGTSVELGRSARPRPSDRWHLDEMVVRIAGKHMYLWMSGSRETRVAPGSIGVRSRLPAGGSGIRTVGRAGGRTRSARLRAVAYLGRNSPATLATADSVAAIAAAAGG